MNNKKKSISMTITIFVFLSLIFLGCSSSLEMPRSSESSMLIGYMEFNNIKKGISVNSRDEFGIVIMRNIPIEEGVYKDCRLVIKKCGDKYPLKLTYNDGYYYYANIDDGCYYFESILINLGNFPTMVVAIYLY